MVKWSVNKFFIFDTDDETTAVGEDFQETDWHDAIQADSLPLIESVKYQKVGMLENILLPARMRDACVRDEFGVIRYLSVSDLVDEEPEWLLADI